MPRRWREPVGAAAVGADEACPVGCSFALPAVPPAYHELMARSGRQLCTAGYANVCKWHDDRAESKDGGWRVVVTALAWKS